MKLRLLIVFGLLNVLVECSRRSDGEFDQEQPNQYDSDNHLARRYQEQPNQYHRENRPVRQYYHDKGHYNKRAQYQEEFRDDNAFRYSKRPYKRVHNIERAHYHSEDCQHDNEFPDNREYHRGKEYRHDYGQHEKEYHQEQHYYRKANRDAANEISTVWPDRESDIPDPPDHTKLVQMARYVLHNAGWASVATISVLPSIEGFPFSNVKSVVDGSIANSTGVPYFYMSPLDFTAKDLARDSRSTILVSLEETRYCEKKKYDPEDPRCTRLMLSGKMRRVKEGTPEYKFAKDALFERHPAMADFPPDHDWFVAKLKIAQVAMVDWFGGAKFVAVKDYLAYNYTGEEVVKNTTDKRIKFSTEYVTVV